MTKKSAKKKSNNLKDILDSDDELPTEYIDLPFVPAYQLDNRFEYIEENKEDKELIKQRNEQSGHLRGGLNNGGTVACAYLNKKDTFCFQCLQPNTGKTTQQWFFNFLLKKDLHASYTFLKTCLVPHYCNDQSIANRKSFRDCNETMWRLKMVASK